MCKSANMLIKAVVRHPLGKNCWRWIYRNIRYLNTKIFIIKNVRSQCTTETYIILVFCSSWWQTIRIDSFQVWIWRWNTVNTNRMWWIGIEDGLLELSNLNRRTRHHWWSCSIWCSTSWTTGTIIKKKCNKNRNIFTFGYTLYLTLK